MEDMFVLTDLREDPRKRSLVPCDFSLSHTLTRYTGSSTLSQKQTIESTKTCPPHTQHGGDASKRDTPTTDVTTIPLTSHSEMYITSEKKCQPQGGTELEYNTATPTLDTPLSSSKFSDDYTG